MTAITFPNCGFIKFKLNESQLYQVKQEIAEIQTDFSKATPWNDKLAGNLQREFKLSDITTNDLEKHILPKTQEFEENFGMIPQEVNSIFKKLFEFGVYAHIKIHENKLSEYWILNPYISWKGSLKSDSIFHQFSSTKIAKLLN